MKISTWVPSPQSAMCFLIPCSQPLVIHACGDLALWMNNIENVLAFLSCPSVHMNGVWIRMAAFKLTILRLALVPRISLLICPSSSTFAIQISRGPIALCEVRLSNEDLNANARKNVGRDKVLVRVLRFAFSLCLCATRCLLSPNVRSCWFYVAKTTTRRGTLFMMIKCLRGL